MFDKTFYKFAISLKDQYESYTGIFLAELCRLFNFSQDKHEAWLFCNKDQPVLFFLKQETIFVKESIELIERNQEFLERRIIPIDHTEITIRLIATAGINYHYNPVFSPKIWIYQDDANFVNKYLAQNPSRQQINQRFWLRQLSFKTEAKNFKKGFYYLFAANQKDQIVYNRYVLADITNDLKINFDLNFDHSLIIPYEKIHIFQHRLGCQNENIFISANNSLFLKMFTNQSVPPIERRTLYEPL